MLVVLGCLLTEAGIKIKEEMLEHFKEHNILCIDQNPPGILFEYPAIKCAAKLAVEMNESVLYVHTKGAGNPIPWYIYNKMPKLSIMDYKPKNAKAEDWQPSVRKMWYYEFNGERLKTYLKELRYDIPMVVCPFSEPKKSTWQNGFIINPLAGAELLKHLHQSTDRNYFEHIFENIDSIIVKGIVYNDIARNLDETNYKMHQYIWSFYDK